MSAPFKQLAFKDVPEKPRLPHAFTRTAGKDVEMDSSTMGKIRIHYREHGSGPPLLLIDGLMTTSYSRRYVFEPLGKQFRVIAPDLPGCGRSGKPKDKSFSPHALTTWMLEFQRALGLVGCLCVGNSMGGYLCMRLALEEPKAFSRLVNVHSPGVADVRLHALKTALGIPGSVSLLRALVMRDPLRWAHRNVHYYDETLKSLEEAREYAEPLSDENGLVCFSRYLRETMSPDGISEFSRMLAERKTRGETFPVPLMLLYARQDPMVPPKIGERLRELVPDAQFQWMESTSHFAHVDTPELVLSHVVPFLTT